LEPLAAGGHRQCLRELVHHAERVLELLAIRGFRDDDPVECPDGVEVERLGTAGKIFELLDGHLVSKVRQVQSELHERYPSLPFVSGSRRANVEIGRNTPEALDRPAWVEGNRSRTRFPWTWTPAPRVRFGPKPVGSEEIVGNRMARHPSPR
jgi:hypothetical protein